MTQATLKPRTTLLKSMSNKYATKCCYSYHIYYFGILFSTVVCCFVRSCCAWYMWRGGTRQSDRRVFRPISYRVSNTTEITQEEAGTRWTLTGNKTENFFLDNVLYIIINVNPVSFSSVFEPLGAYSDTQLGKQLFLPWHPSLVNIISHRLKVS